MSSKPNRVLLILIIAAVIAGMASFPAQGVWAAPAKGDAKATTKAAEKPKTVVINMVVMSEENAEVDISVQKIEKKKTTPLLRTVSLKKGANYFTYNKGTKGNYKISVSAYGDTIAQNVTAVQGTYTMFFSVAPPKDGDAKKKSPITYQDLTNIKQKK